MIEVRDLVKSFGRGDEAILDHISLTVQKGSIFGILGSTGAGKTTLLRILAGTLRPDAGDVRVAGRRLPQEARRAWRDVALVPERGHFGEWDTALEYLRFWGRVAGLPGQEVKSRVSDLWTLAGLDGAEDLVLEGATVDVETRINLIQALLTDPPVVLLDEPFTGMTGPQREDFTQVLRTLQGRGKTVVLTAGHLRGVRRSCERVAVLEEGSVLAAMATSDLLARIGRGRHARIFVDVEGQEGLLNAVRGIEGVVDAKTARDVLVVYVNPGILDKDVLVRELEGQGVEARQVREAEITLGDVFRALHQEGRG